VTRIVTLLMIYFLAVAPASAQNDDINVDSLVQEVDRLYRAESAYAKIEMEIVTPHWQRTLTMNSWSEGMDKTFIHILAPAREKDIATLRIDNEMWNYLPKANKVMKIPPSMMMGSWMGSDFTNDDLVKESSLFEDYSYKLIEPDSGKRHMYYVNCIPREDLPVVWGNIVIAVSRENHMPVWQKYYDEKGKLMRVMNYSDIRTIGGRMIPTTMEMIPQSKEGHKTVIRYLDVEFDIKLDPETFTLRNLRTRK
jgi:outer membrane lipoprotein-sorting protein